MKHLKTILFVGLGGIALAFYAINNQAITGVSPQPPSKATVSDTVKKTYKLKEFKQSCCSAIVEYSLKEVKGYIKSEVDMKKQEITVWFDSSKSKEKEIKKAINRTAYKIIEE